MGRYKNISVKAQIWVYILVALVLAVVGYFAENTTVWRLATILDTATAVALAILAFFAYMEYLSNEEEVRIFFDVDGRVIDTGLTLLRKDFSRMELMGILGMLQKDQDKRYRLHFFQTPESLDQIQKVQKGLLDKYVVKMDSDEFKQFTLSER